MVYKTLNADKVMATIDRLEAWLSERFPDSGLRNVASELSETARRCAAEPERLRQPIMALRVFVYTIWALGAAALVWLAVGLHMMG